MSILAKIAAPKTHVTFNEIYSRYKQRIYVYCLQFLQNREQAEDVFQEICIKIYKHESELAEKENVAAWIFTVARNTCLNALRDRGIGQRYVEFVEPDSLAFHPDGMPTLECDVKDYIEWALNQLPVELRETIILREFQEFSYEEIAKITATSLTNVKVRIFRARERLRKILAPIFLEEENHG
jgi:RNA polymerase sigma-70 factor (ECF subfamily)